MEDFLPDYDDYESDMDTQIDQVKYYLIESLYQS